jgi:hypothetical protein
LSLEVIGAGWGRTATTSLKSALEILGFAPCHHMHDVLANQDEQVPFFQAAVDGKEMDWDALFGRYKAAVDWPASHYWRELAEYYPDAKLILSVRDEESWWNSFCRTILVPMQVPLETIQDPQRLALSKMVNTLIADHVFKCAPDDKDAVLARYRAHIEDVKKSLPADRLLILDLEHESGWEPVCEFLDHAIPTEPYPFLNTSHDFEQEKKHYRS